MIKKLKLRIRTTLLILCSVISAITVPIPIHALTTAQLEYYNANGITWYNPEGGYYTTCYSGDITVQGSNAKEKIWSGLIQFMTPEQAAGVMGNMQSESAGTFNPVIHEISFRPRFSSYDIETDDRVAYGVGLIQWSYGRRVGMLNYIKSNNPSLLRYFLDPEQYGKETITGDKFIQIAGEDVFNQLVQLELEYLKTELNSSYQGFFNQTTIYDATKYFLENVEKPKVPTISAHMNRVSQAESYYRLYSNYTPMGTTLSGSAGSSSTTPNNSLSSLTILGNSLISGVQPYLKIKLNDSNNDIDYRAGNYFTSNPAATEAGIKNGKEVLQELKDSGELRKNVFYALGANDVVLEGDHLAPTVTQSDIDEIIDIVGSERNLYFMTNYTKLADFSGVNQLIKQTASKYSNVYVVDYANLLSNHEEYIGDDGVHLTDKGYTEFAKLIASSLKTVSNTLSGSAGSGSGSYSNFTSNGCTYTGNFQQTVQKYAWPTYRGKDIEPTQDYANAVRRRVSEGKYVGGDDHPGIDCGGFVTAVMQDSGFASDYNSGKGNTTVQENWVKDNGWQLLNTNANTPIVTTVLQPGDVAFVTGHTFVYVGDIGFETKIASASLDTRAPMSGKESLTIDSDRHEVVRWYRKP